jgi:uncharacterized protein (TIGR04255 family)
MIQAPPVVSAIPDKLTHDAIVEALLEIRFDHDSVSEVVVGQLTAASAWAGYRVQRLPLADMPAAIRDSEAEFRYQPILQLQRPEAGEILKIGAHVISLHTLAPYPGWPTFGARLQALVAVLFEAVDSPNINRVGLRYLNALTQIHGISDLWDLNINFKIDGSRPSSEFMASYRFDPRDDMRGQATIATQAFVAGAAPDALAFIDIDVSTPNPLGQISRQDVLLWLEDAHQFEKKAFFELWPEKILSKLREV